MKMALCMALCMALWAATVTLGAFAGDPGAVAEDTPGAVAVNLMAYNTPRVEEAQPGDILEAPIAVMAVTGAPGDGWKRLEAAVRYDPVRLQYLGAEDLGIVPGRVLYASEGPRSPDSVLRRVAVAYEAYEETTAAAPLYQMRFKVRDLPAGTPEAVTRLDFDSCNAIRAAGAVYKAATVAPVDIRITPAFGVDVWLDIRKKTP